MKNIKKTHLAIIIIASVLLALLNPFKMDLNQSILFSALFFTIAVWATGAVHKSLACVFLLIASMIFGKTEPMGILGYLWSDTNLLIITTTLLSAGIMKTGIIHRYFEKLFKKTGGSMLKMLLLPYIFGIVLIFIIPQAFARVIIMGTIFSSLLQERNDGEKQAKQALIFNVFIAVSMVYMLFSNGDIVLNMSAIRFGGEEVKNALSFGAWFKMMILPTLLTSLTTLALTYFVFRKELSNFSLGMMSGVAAENKELTKPKQYVAVVVMLVIIGFWMTAGLHSVSPWLVSAIGVGVMFAFSVLETKDLKSVNPHFILFLMTIFSIGKILGQSGISAVIFDSLKSVIPAGNTGFYLVIMIFVVMVMHLIIGSSVATMSVVLPIIVPLSTNLGYRPEVITLMTYVLVNIHFLLPMHQANVMIGTARDYYPSSYMLRFGAYMTVLSPVIILIIFLPWWKFLGYL